MVNYTVDHNLNYNETHIIKSMSNKPPSRKKYEENNPIISFRISKEQKEELDQRLENLDITRKEWLENQVQKQRQNQKDIEIDETDKYKKGYEEGYKEGKEDAKEEFIMKVPCDICGEPMTVINEDCKETIYEIIETTSNLDRDIITHNMDPYEDIPEWNWSHSKCVE